MTRSTAKYLVLLALAVALFYWKTLLTNQFTVILGSEGVNQAYSWLHFWGNSIRHGQVPLWDPYAFCGRPFAGEIVPATFYPMRLIFALAPLNRHGMISPRLFHEYLVLVHVMGAYFLFALARELRLSRFAAFLGACSFALGGMLARMLWPAYVEAGMWLPAIFLFLLRAFRQKERGRALAEASLGGLAIGMSILTGGLHFTIMQGIVVATASIFQAFGPAAGQAFDQRRHRLQTGLIVAVMLAVGAGVGAVQLLPSSEYTHEVLRFISDGAYPAHEKIPYHRMVPGGWPQSVVTALFPTGFDGKLGGGEGWTFYIGVLPLFLAVTAIWRCWSELWVRYLTVLAALAFAYSLGELSPLHGVLYALVPYLWVIRSATRFVYLVSFALALLAAFGWDAITEPAERPGAWAPATRFLKWVAIVCAAALFLPAVWTGLTVGVWTSLSLLLILASCGWYVRLTRGPAGQWLRVGLACFVLFDLSAFEWLEMNKAFLVRTGDDLEQMVSLGGAAGFVKSRPGLDRVRVDVQPEPNIGDVYGVQSAWGGGATVLKNFSRLRPYEDLLNVRYVIRPAAAGEPGALYHDRQWKVYENRKAFPRAWLVHKAVVEASQEAVFQKLEKPGMDLRQVAMVEAPLAGPLEEARGASEAVAFRAYEANRMAADVQSAGAGLLVLSEIYYPGWRASVNGQRAEIRRVDGGLRGIAVPGGNSRVVLEYVPLRFYAGAGVTLATLAAVLAGWIQVGRKRGWPDSKAAEREAAFETHSG